VQQPTLVLWGRQDEILPPSTAAKFEQALPNGRLVWVEACGHCAHLEQPQFAAEQIMAFFREGVSQVARPP
jgi:pimeloyl-ACP methyl ester carboxylesterase